MEGIVFVFPRLIASLHLCQIFYLFQNQHKSLVYKFANSWKLLCSSHKGPLNPLLCRVSVSYPKKGLENVATVGPYTELITIGAICHSFS